MPRTRQRRPGRGARCGSSGNAETVKPQRPQFTTKRAPAGYVAMTMHLFGVSK